MAALPTAPPPADSSDPLKLALFLQNPATPLSPLQLRVATALARGLSVTSAAAESGVHRTTVHHWIRTSPEFDAAIRSARAEASARCRAELHALTALALQTLRSILESPATPPAVRLRAALAALRGDLLPNPALIDDWPLPDSADPGPETPSGGPPLDPPTSPQTAEPTPLFQPPSRDLALLAPAWAPKPEATPVAKATVPRNAPCPCGSGRKFKRCCGVDAPPLLTC